MKFERMIKKPTKSEENMKKNQLFTLVMLTVAGLVMSACQPAGVGDAPGDTEQASEAVQETPESPEPEIELPVLMDPAMFPELEANTYVYETLLMVEEGQTVPALALEYTVSEDGLDYILALRPGVSFHNGKVLSADAVIANFNRWFDPEDSLRGSGTYGAWASNFGGFKGDTIEDGQPKSTFDGIEKVDELTVLIHLNTPDPDFLTKMANPAFAIISPDALAAPDFGTTAGVDGGTGPYMIGEFSADGLTLEPNPDYWNPEAIPASSLEITP
jgi:peptide/nickel transport system substrate-binding protein